MSHCLSDNRFPSDCFSLRSVPGHFPWPGIFICRQIFVVPSGCPLTVLLCEWRNVICCNVLREQRGTRASRPRKIMFDPSAPFWGASHLSSLISLIHHLPCRVHCRLRGIAGETPTSPVICVSAQADLQSACMEYKHLQCEMIYDVHNMKRSGECVLFYRISCRLAHSSSVSCVIHSLAETAAAICRSSCGRTAVAGLAAPVALVPC